MSVNPTAILLFTRTAQEEAAAKSWMSRGKNRRIAKLFIKHSCKIARGSELPFILHTSKVQRGYSFGERLQFAFQSAFDAGYENIICIGNDSLELTSTNLKEAQRQLERDNNWVLGPAQDGGVYLIGISKNCFEQLDWRSLPWQGGQLFTCLQAALGQLGRGRLLAEQQDVDDAQDIFELIQKLANRIKIIFDLCRLFCDIRPARAVIKPIFRQHQIPLMVGGFRGPPSGM